MQSMKLVKPTLRAMLSALISGILLWLATGDGLQAAPFAKQISFTQPGGNVILLWGQGDEFYAVFETLDGYTVVFDPALKAYCYAELSADGNALVSTGRIVTANPPANLGLAKHLRISADARRKQVAQRFATWDAGMQVSTRWAALKAAARQAESGGAVMSPPSRPTVGNKTGLCLLIDFSDDPATVPQDEIDNFCNGDNYTGFGNNGSVKRYYQDVSGGLLTYSNVVTIYIRAPHPKSYYNDTTKDAGLQARMLITDALGVMMALTNYTTDILPTFDALTVDGSKNVVAFNVFYAGDNGGVWSMGLWPHSWSLASPVALSPGGKRVLRYQISNIGNALEIGTFCHENGHMLCGYPDLYDYTGMSAGVGFYCLMAAGSYGGPGSDGSNPVQICAYLKRASGWATTTDLTASSNLVASVSAPAGTNFNHFYRYQKPGTSTEYFLMENRQRSGRDKYIPSAGVAIWHIDELGDNSSVNLSPNSSHNNYEATLVQADNLWDLEHNRNNGDSKDLWNQANTAAAYKNVFSDTSTPNAHWWSGQTSSFNLRLFSTNAPTMTFVVGTAPLIPVITTQPVSQVVLTGDTVTFTVVADGMPPLQYQWLKEGAVLPGATNASYVIASAQSGDAGNYTVTVATDYGSVTSSNALLTVMIPVPLAEALDATNLIWTTGGDAPWAGWTLVTHDGVDAGQSGRILETQQSWVGTTVSGPGTLSFWWKVSSQAGADFLVLSLNGTPIASISGEVDWQQQTIYLPAGSDQLTWSYSKGAAGSAGQDLAWLDQVSFVAGPIAPTIVTQPAGVSLVAGSPVTFSVTALGTPPLRYQWFFNGTPIPGATTTAYSLANAWTTNTGVYSVLVSNDYAGLLSSNALLSVVPVAAWGYNGFNQTTIMPELTNVVALAAGGYHSLALRADGSVFAWGDDWDGQCDVPPDLANVVAIAGGGYHSLAATADGTVAAWGADYYSQTDVPAAATGVVAVAAGAWHSLALKSDGTVVAWGDDNWGQAEVPPSLANVIAIAAGGQHNLALKRDGTVVAWGGNVDAAGNYVGQATVPPNLNQVIAVAAGDYHSLALKADGTVVAWGDGSLGQTALPAGLTNAVAIAAGGTHSLAVLQGGVVIGWGDDLHGESTVATNLSNAQGIAAGGYHSLALLGPTLPAPRLSNPQFSSGGFSVLVSTVRGKSYLLQFKNSLAATNWSTIAITPGDNTARPLSDAAAKRPSGFYRVRQQ